MGEKFLKISLMTFNILCFMGGVAMLSGGLLISFQPSIAETLKTLSGTTVSSTSMSSLGYAMVVLGSFIVLVAFVGCCGVMSESKCMLGLYVIILVILFLGQITVGVLGIVYGKEGVKKVLETTFQEYADDYQNANSIKLVHETFQCCGANGTEGYLNKYFATTTTANMPSDGNTNANLSTTTVAPTTTMPTTMPATTASNNTSNDTMTATPPSTTESISGIWPDSCCKRNEKGYVNLKECHNYMQKNMTILQQYVNTGSCINSVSKFVDDNLIVIGACCVALAVIELLAIIIGCKLHRSLD